MISAEERLSAACAWIGLCGVPESLNAVEGASLALIRGEVTDRDSVERLEALRTLSRENADAQALLGCHVARADVSAALVTRFLALDDRLRAKFTGIAEQALLDASTVVGVSIRRAVVPSKLSPDERALIDGSPVEFVRGLRPVVRAALNVDEVALAVAAVNAAADLVEADLIEASELIADELEDSEELEEAHERDIPRARALFVAAMTALVLGRLGRATDGDQRTLADTTVADGVARDLLEVAGGAASTDVGGIVRDNGRVVLVDGSPKRGAGFALSDNVLDASGETRSPVRVFVHSGKRDSRDTHRRADGRTEDQLGGSVFPGQFPDCGCSWRLEFR